MQEYREYTFFVQLYLQNSSDFMKSLALMLLQMLLQEKGALTL